MNIEQYRALKAQEVAQTTEQPTSNDTDVKTQNTPLEDSNAKQSSVKTEPKTEDKTTEEVVENKPKQFVEKIPEKITIDGIGEVTFEELKNGYLRQSDYTKKTQSIAKQRKEQQDAIAFFEFLKQNPEIAKQVVEVTKGAVPRTIDPNQARIIELQNELFDMKLEMEINKLQNKYPDFDVREVLEMAQAKNLTNLEDAYKLVKSNKPAKETNVDIDALKAQIRDEIMREMEKESKDTKTIITAKNGGNKIISDNSPKLSEAEKKVALKMFKNEKDPFGEYAKWRDAGRQKK